ncbi:MAG: RNA methyltransferase [Phycisphaerae bacterium]|jgi:TrmH family RNA methyltransferase
MLERIRVVLVSPSGPANIGAVARMMANLGLTDLVIVSPRCDVRDEQAVAYASHGDEVLAAARVVEDIPAALVGCVSTYATSSKLGMYRRQVAITPAVAGEEVVTAAQAGPVALVFGREDFGLRTRELLHFDRIITIPADESYPVFNLAAAATIVCYEVRKAWLAAEEKPALPRALHSGWATQERKERLFEKLFEALAEVGFLLEPNPDHLKYALRHLLGRVSMSVNEADILIGMARQIQWYVRHHPQRVEPVDEA